MPWPLEKAKLTSLIFSGENCEQGVYRQPRFYEGFLRMIIGAIGELTLPRDI